MKKRTETLLVLAALVVFATLLALWTNNGVWKAQRLSACFRLQTIRGGLLSYCESYRSFPPRVYHDTQGNSTVSWRLKVADSIAAFHFPMKIDVTIPWNKPPNSDTSAIPHRLFCPPGEGDTTDTQFFGIGCDDSVFNRRGLTHINAPNDLLLAAWTPMASGLNWASPGDLCLDSTEKDCHLSLTAIPENFRVVVIFMDGQVWECSDRNAFLEFAKFANVKYAREHDRDKVTGVNVRFIGVGSTFD